MNENAPSVHYSENYPFGMRERIYHKRALAVQFKLKPGRWFDRPETNARLRRAFHWYLSRWAKSHGYKVGNNVLIYEAPVSRLEKRQHLTGRVLAIVADADSEPITPEQIDQHGDRIYVAVLSDWPPMREAVSPFDELAEHAQTEYRDGRTKNLRPFAKEREIEL